MSNPNGNKQSQEHKQPEEQQEKLMRDMDINDILESEKQYYRARLQNPTNVLAERDDSVVKALPRHA